MLQVWMLRIVGTVLSIGLFSIVVWNLKQTREVSKERLDLLVEKKFKAFLNERNLLGCKKRGREEIQCPDGVYKKDF